MYPESLGALGLVSLQARIEPVEPYYLGNLRLRAATGRYARCRSKVHCTRRATRTVADRIEAWAHDPVEKPASAPRFGGVVPIGAIAIATIGFCHRQSFDSSESSQKPWGPVRRCAAGDRIPWRGWIDVLLGGVKYS